MSILAIQLKGTNVRLYPGEPQLWANTPGGEVWRDLDRRMLRVQIGAERRVRVRTGRLLATIHREPSIYRRYPAMSVVAGRRGMKYTMMEHDGTPPHIITPRRKKALSFQVGGVTVFAQRVKHPGTTGTFYLTKSLPLAAG